MVTRASATVRITDSTFGVLDGEEFPFESGTWSNGLVRVLSTGASIATGISMGNVEVTTILRETQPAEIDPGPWDEIVDVSLWSKHGDLRVSSLEAGPIAALPPLSTRGPANYRMRVHAAGRDLYRDLVHTEPTEHFLLVVWPAVVEPEVIIRLTDRTGYSLRLSQARSAHNPRVPINPPEWHLQVPMSVRTEHQRRADREQNLRNVAAGLGDIPGRSDGPRKAVDDSATPQTSRPIDP